MAFTEAYAREESYMLQVNEWYYGECRDAGARQVAYDSLLDLDNADESGAPNPCPLSPIHYAMRGRYQSYPERWQTHPASDLFVRCVRCNKPYCTDAWRPYGYEALDRYVTLTATGAYRCRDESHCRL